DGEPVPGTNILAVVATIDAIADQRAQLPGYRSAQLDGEIGNAETGVHNIRRDDRPCGTRSDTTAAGAAVILPGTVGFQLEVEEHHADKKPGTLLPGDQIRVLSHPADRRLRAPHFFHDRPGVHIVKPARTRLFPLDEVIKPLQALLHQKVIIVPPSVTADPSAQAIRRR